MKKSPSDRKQVHKNIERKKQPKKTQCVNGHKVILTSQNITSNIVSYFNTYIEIKCVLKITNCERRGYRSKLICII